MKTLIFNGSPRTNGDTARLIREVATGLRGVCRVVDVYRSDIAPCVDCRRCWTRPGCAIRDGMQELYDEIRSCDNVLIASPVYFSELTGPLLGAMSRLQMFYCNRRFLDIPTGILPKRGAVLLAGGGDGRPERAAETARTLLRHMNAREIHPTVCSGRTDRVPAEEDEAALAGARDIAKFFNENRSFEEG